MPNFLSTIHYIDSSGNYEEAAGLQYLSDNYVHKTGSHDETINGVKTFSDKPVFSSGATISITPSSSTDATNKGYVDDEIGPVYEYMSAISNFITISARQVYKTPSLLTTNKTVFYKNNENQKPQFIVVVPLPNIVTNLYLGTAANYSHPDPIKISDSACAIKCDRMGSAKPLNVTFYYSDGYSSNDTITFDGDNFCLWSDSSTELQYTLFRDIPQL